MYHVSAQGVDERMINYIIIIIIIIIIIQAMEHCRNIVGTL